MSRYLTAGFSASLTIAVVVLGLATGRALAAPPERAALFTMKPDGSDVALFLSLPNKIWNGSPSYSPDGAKVVFDASREVYGGPASHVFVAAVENPLETAEDLGLGNCPCWSPDGTQIIFEIAADNPEKSKPGIWTMNRDGTDRAWLCEGERGRWSPDGTRVVVQSKSEGFESLYVVTPRFRKRVLFEPYDRVIGACWSCDGSRLAFIGVRNDLAELATLGAKGEPDSFAVRWRGKIGWQPAWSPDGKQILFWVNDGTGATRLSLIDVEGDGAPREIAGQQGTFHNSDASWSPDGTRIIFSSDRALPGEQ